MFEESKRNYYFKGVLNKEIVEKLIEEVLKDVGLADEDAEQKEINECYQRKSVRRCRRRSECR